MTKSRQTVPWWGRLEARVIGALALIGGVCVGASAYLVHIAVSYFDVRLEHALDESRAIATAVEPFHRDLIAAHVDAYEARARSFAFEVAAGGSIPLVDRLRTISDREADVVALEVRVAEAAPVRSARDREPVGETYVATAALPASTGEDARSGEIEVHFAIDPGLDERYQSIGERRRRIGQQRANLPELESAALRGLLWTSLAVLMLALLAGVAIARATTRKVGELSRLMTLVSMGDFRARASELGRDELGQLASAFNDMLDQLDAAQQKVAYLQRVSTWQDVARRLAHEIKNPLTPIQLAVQQLREKNPGLSAEFTRLLEASADIVEDEVGALRRMVDSFAQFARVPEVELARVSLTRIVHDFERAYGYLLREEDRLEVRLPEREIFVDGDRQLLRQVLVNLVENAALSAREAGPVHVRIEVSRPGDVELRVEDNGPGIEPARRAEVFEPYFTTRREGSGIGLAIVKKIVLDHGGTVVVEDGVLGGAAFVIRLTAREG